MLEKSAIRVKFYRQHQGNFLYSIVVAYLAVVYLPLIFFDSVVFRFLKHVPFSLLISKTFDLSKI